MAGEHVRRRQKAGYRKYNGPTTKNKSDRRGGGEERGVPLGVGQTPPCTES